MALWGGVSGVVLLSVLVPISWAGLWGPYELETAELSRRVAVALHGASQLALPGQDNRVPILSELGKGQLPFSSVAVGFQIFGLSDWAGRLPLALWALLGLFATYLLLSRLGERVSAVYAAIVLSTTPLYFLQARTLLGDAVTLAAAPIATLGLTLATFGGSDETGDKAEGRARALWALAGFAGLAAGFASRGALVGVACPALGVGLAWLMLRTSRGALSPRASSAFGAMSLVLGTLALAAGGFVLFRRSNPAFLEVLGASLNEPAKFPSYDAVVHWLGFAFFPWSAALPFLLAIVLRAGKLRSAHENALCITLLNVSVIALGIHGAAAPFIGQLPFVATFALAGLLAIAFRDLERNAGADSKAGARLLLVATASLLVVLAQDLREAPERVLKAFFLGEATFPESFADGSKRWFTYGTLSCLLVLSFAFGELASADARGEVSGKRAAFAFSDPAADYRGWLDTLRTAWQGRLLLLLLVFGACTVVLSSLVFIDGRFMRIGALAKLGMWRAPLRYSFVLVPALVALPWLTLLGRDAARHFFSRVPIGRVRFALAGIATFALAMSVGYYPALANHVSPRNVFDAYRRMSGANEPLAVLGESSAVAPYYARSTVTTPADTKAAMEWLLAGDEARWLLLGAKDLAPLNALYREHVKPASNLPVVDASSSAALLATNRLPPNAANQNPLAAWIEREPPKPEHPLDVDLEGQLKCLGWSVTDVEGRPLPALRRSRAYLRLYWQVLAPVRGNWKTFVHIDGNGRRLNGDHETLEGRYPVRYWRPNDFITDVHPIEVEAQFPPGPYRLYFGMFSGGERLKVQRGAHDDNRIAGGEILIQ
jgi:4-amino-4-deoxy-L-arabinose transferase-like glycosyltransferase